MPPDPYPPEEPTRSLGQAVAIAARVLEQPPERREAALAAACAGDRDLHQQVVRILRTGVGGAPPAAPTAPDAAPAALARYELHEPLGEGSMGVVYRARQTDTGRMVALKRLRPGAQGEAMLGRFRREIALLARLNHPCIVQILDAGHAGAGGAGEPFLAMDLVVGKPLLAGAQQLGLDRRARIQVLVQLCRAIGHAHRRGVIHRDLKPDNVLLEGEGPTAPMRPCRSTSSARSATSRRNRSTATWTPAATSTASARSATSC
jgi:serine/threonine protein kinase